MPGQLLHGGLMQYRILVTGSRDWDDESVLAWELGKAVGEGIRLEREVVVVHGDCPTGADAIAKSLCNHYGVDTEPHPAPWGQYGKGAGPIRNSQMVRLGADICLGFRRRESSGTTDCLTKAAEARIPIMLIDQNH